jgi:CheY-like chemotaxis protein
MKELILLVDDDRLPMKFYVKALLQKDFEVEHCLEPDSALAFARKKTTKIALIIMDIMMPPGETYRYKDTKEGLITGTFLFKDLRKEDCCPNTPIVVLTNVRNPETLDKFNNQGLVKLVQKMQCPPFELVEIVCEMLSVAYRTVAHNQISLNKTNEQKKGRGSGS